MMRILVTGSSGFVGSRLADSLRARNCDVVEFDIADGFDLLDMASFDGAPDVDAVVHLAAKMFVPFAFSNPREIYATNITGTLNVLEFCRQRSVKRIVFASSYVYGTPRYLPVDEKHPAEIRNPYGRSKVMGEMLCTAFYEDFGIVPVIVRPFNIYGPGQAGHFLIPEIIGKALADPVIRVNDLDPKRDYVYIDDMIDAYVKCIFDFHGSAPAVFNVGSGESRSVGEITDMIRRLSGVEKEVVCENKKRMNEVPDCVADISVIRETLGWTPRVSMEEGLAKTIEWYRTNGR